MAHQLLFSLHTSNGGVVILRFCIFFGERSRNKVPGSRTRRRDGMRFVGTSFFIWSGIACPRRAFLLAFFLFTKLDLKSVVSSCTWLCLSWLGCYDFGQLYCHTFRNPEDLSPVPVFFTFSSEKVNEHLTLHTLPLLEAL